MERKRSFWFIGIMLTIALAISVVYCIFYMDSIKNPYTLKLNELKPIDAVLKELDSHQVFESKMARNIFLNIYKIQSVPRGRYEIKDNIGHLNLFRKLKYGIQDPISFTISSATFIEDIASRVGNKFMIDSATFIDFIMSNESMMKYGYHKETALCQFYPNTYDIYWDASPQQIFEKIKVGRKKFWDEQTKAKLHDLGMTEDELYILASLVQKEYYKKDERSRIAGVLYNRLKINMALQIDASCKYATRDFAAKRVLDRHTQFPSPYNTYLNIGLPPGPICMPETGTLKDCLNPESHNFLYYCADPSLNGYHIFNETLRDHENVAKSYHQKMKQLNL